MANKGGTEITQPSYFRRGKNVSGSTIGKNLVVMRGTNEMEVQLPAAVTSRHFGVTSEDIPDQGVRSIQTEGKALIKCSAAVPVHTEVQAGTDGRIATAVTGSQIVGMTCNAGANANDLVEVELYKGRFIAP
jgi:hypothetical protein